MNTEIATHAIMEDPDPGLLRRFQQSVDERLQGA
jgi:hypothetical protein